MEIETLRFGKINVQQDKVITFPKGILGFSSRKKFILFPHSENSPFFWLQSIDDGELAFVTMNPTLVEPDFNLDLAEDLAEDLQTSAPDELEVMCIVTVPNDHPENMTINMLGPIIINTAKKLAVQVISTSGKYSHRHPVIRKSQDEAEGQTP